MRDVTETPVSTLQIARDIALQNGLRYVYTGNVHDEAGQSTYCHNCDERLIGRDWYEITSWTLDSRRMLRKMWLSLWRRIRDETGLVGGPLVGSLRDRAEPAPVTVAAKNK